MTNNETRPQSVQEKMEMAVSVWQGLCGRSTRPGWLSADLMSIRERLPER